MLGSLLVITGILLWFAPFITAKRGRGSLVAVDRRSRWGLLLEVISLSFMLQSHFWTVTQISWRVVASAIFFLLAAILSWTATRALGSQLRFDAAIGEKHELICTGPYRLMRHPIYGSMLCLLLGMGFLAAPPWIFASAMVLFLVGTEIRVHIEDRLLHDQFGEKFERYRDATRAYLPPIR